MAAIAAAAHAVRASAYQYSTGDEADRLLAELDRLAAAGGRMAG
ncbi:hypothetical protein [Micromonospora sp. KC207]|nr:hypothetical protein [Micromonospora sp. KC207]